MDKFRLIRELEKFEGYPTIWMKTIDKDNKIHFHDLFQVYIDNEGDIIFSESGAGGINAK